MPDLVYLVLFITFIIKNITDIIIGYFIPDILN
jgi:hypothetical protein